ncbi:MAG: hypothetical protein DRR19_11415 [Candidatus Parabeggiatoa sp. nov. 1]|nr:MAG: hypothetical protein DRR19_11415 [Gammaproteobacteria bacterium]
MSLPATIVPTEVLETYLEPVLEGKLTDVYREYANGYTQKIAEGYECLSTCTVERDGQVIVWEERRLVVRSFKHTKAQKTAEQKRLAKAEAALANLTIHRRGKKRLTTLAEIQSTTDDILKRYQVEGVVIGSML